MVEKKDPSEMWRGWMVFYQTEGKVWLPVASYPKRSEAYTQSLIYGTTNSLKTKVKRVKVVAY